MKRINRYALTLVSAALACGTAVAQERAAEPGVSQSRPLKAGEVQASRLIGAPVKNSSGDTIGEVADLVVASGDVNLAVISVGGVLGLGEKKIALSYDELSVSPDGRTLYAHMSQRDLEAKPAFDPDGDVAAPSAAARARGDTTNREIAPERRADGSARAVDVDRRDGRVAASERASTSAASPAAAGQSTPARTLKPTEQAASSLIGAPLLDSGNSRIGKLHDLVVSTGRQSVQAILAIGGGVAGLGAHLVAVPLDDLTVKRDADESHRRNADSVQTRLTVSQLEAMPEFRYQ